MRKSFFLAFYLLFWPVLFFVYGAELVDINTASLAQLDNLVGIGPSLGQGIIDNRPYTSIDDLLKIKGIGPKNLEKIKQQGIACVNCQELIASSSIESATTQQESVSKLADLPAEVLTEAGRQESLQNKNIIPNDIFINEILPSPEGPDTENEFIEIFNANNFEVDLLNWKIKDKVGAVKSYSLPQNTKISANGLLVLKSSQTKISLNNTGDGVEILNPAGQIIDSADYIKAKQGQSWSKSENTWGWTAKPTPGQINVIITTKTSATSSFNTATSSKEKQPLANIQNYPPKSKNLLAVSVAIVIALVSALIAWQIKKKSAEI